MSGTCRAGFFGCNLVGKQIKMVVHCESPCNIWLRHVAHQCWLKSSPFFTSINYGCCSMRGLHPLSSSVYYALGIGSSFWGKSVETEINEKPIVNIDFVHFQLTYASASLPSMSCSSCECTYKYNNGCTLSDDALRVNALCAYLLPFCAAM